MTAQPQHKRGRLLKEIWNLPNTLTMARIAAIPAVLYFMVQRDPLHAFYAVLVFGVASATDGLDGYIARKTGAITMLGKFLDPLADKLLVMSCLVYMVQMGTIEAWLAVVLIAREMSITGLRAIASGEGLVIAASAGGKSKTAFQMAGLSALIIHYPYPIWGTNAVVDFHIVGTYLLYISLLFSLFSAMEYIQLFIEEADDEEDGPGEEEEDEEGEGDEEGSEEGEADEDCGEDRGEDDEDSGKDDEDDREDGEDHEA